MLDVLITSAPPPFNVKLAILIAPFNVELVELVNVSACAPVTPPTAIVPLPVLITLVPPNDTVPNDTTSFVVFTVPFNVVVLAVLVNPPLKLKVSLPLPNVTPLVLLNVTALVNVLVLPLNTTA